MLIRQVNVDLESRKRAPLYQKRQEEELKAAIDKAQECEIRAQDAEIKQKEAKVTWQKHGLQQWAYSIAHDTTRTCSDVT